MISVDKLRPGLLALAEITHSSVDAVTERLWHYATRDLTEDQWRHGVDVTIRTWKSTWMPPPAVVIEAAYTAPPPPPRAYPIRDSEGMWSSEQQAAFVEQVVRENPREATESSVDYAGRIARLAGLMSPAAREREAGQEG